VAKLEFPPGNRGIANSRIGVAEAMRHYMQLDGVYIQWIPDRLVEQAMISDFV